MKRWLLVEPTGVAHPLLAQKRGVGKNHRLLAFSRKERSSS